MNLKELAQRLRMVASLMHDPRAKGPVVEAADLIESLDAQKPVAWRSRNQCLYRGLWDYSEEASDHVEPEPLYAAPVAQPATAEQKLASAGVFKGAEGLRGLAECGEFWDQQPYGTRLYYNGGAYLHRSILQEAVRLLDTAPVAQPVVPEEPVKYATLHQSFSLDWGVAGVGFGQLYFRKLADGNVEIDSECMGKQFIKKILCAMVDAAVLTDAPQPPKERE